MTCEQYPASAGCATNEVVENGIPGALAGHPSHPGQPSTLPVTGGDVAGLVGMGLVASFVGAWMVRRSRKMRAALRPVEVVQE